MQRRTAVLESIRSDRQCDAVYGEHAKTIIAFHDAAARRQANVRAMYFRKPRRGAPREPFEKKHQPLMTIGAFPSRAATFIEVQQTRRFGCNRNSLVVALGIRPVDGPMQHVVPLMRFVPKLHGG